jgi:membrane protein required for colicin V production
VPFALRGWWRGFCREVFSLGGLVVGGLAAAAAAGPGGAALVAREILSPAAARAAAFVGIFVGVVVVANVLGQVADRFARALFLGGLNRLAGVAFGSLKGGVALGFGLLLAERLLGSSTLTRAIGASTLGRPLTELATNVLVFGRSLTAAHGEAA